MRNQQELNVDAHTASIRAADRTRANRRLQEAVQPPRAAEPWWSKLWHDWFKWEKVIVGDKTVDKGWIVPTPLGIALLMFLLGTAVTTLGVAGTLYWKVTDAVGIQANETRAVREQLIRLDERLIQKDNGDRERHDNMQEELEGMKSHQAAIESLWNKQFAEMKAQRR